MIKKDIRLDLLSADKRLQQRPLDDDTLSRYIALMDDGIKFPPIEVVSDGSNFWIWDGFHRIECARRRGKKTIAAYVKKGKLRDAIWLSFGANKAHGLSRQRGVAKHIIEQILTDKTWSKKSLAAIARHVGVTREYVSKTKAELSAHGVNSSHHRNDENGDSKLKTQDHGSTTCTIEVEGPALHRADEIEVERGGKTYTQRSQEKQHKADESRKDMAGRVIPEHLQELYEGREIIAGFVRDLTQIKNDVMKRIDARDPVFSLMNVTAFQAEYETLRRRLKFCIPYAVCVYCGGDSKDCKACKGFGLLNEQSYELAPKELKP